MSGGPWRSPVTALYVPGNRPDRFDKAVATGADIVIVDLEDAVAAGDKVIARDHVVGWLSRRPAGQAPSIQVRVNAVGTPWFAADVAALPSGTSIRLPKVESADDVTAVAVGEVHAILESARAIEQAFQIAAHPAVMAIGLGEADLAADIGSTEESVLAWCRTRVVIAARAAGLPAPMMSVYPDIRDLTGLADSCAAGKALGMRGRAAIHPAQVPVIAAAFAPSQAELAWANEVVRVLEASGGRVAVLDDGAMVDAAMARRAVELLARATS